MRRRHSPPCESDARTCRTLPGHGTACRGHFPERAAARCADHDSSRMSLPPGASGSGGTRHRCRPPRAAVHRRGTAREQERRHVMVEERRARRKPLGDLIAARVALRADLLCFQMCRQSGVFPDAPHQGRISRPLHVRRRRPVTRLARHIQFGPRRLELVRARVVAFPDLRRMAVGTLIIPVLLPASPVKLVSVRHAGPGRQRKPALAAVGGWPRIPRDRGEVASGRPRTERDTAGAERLRMCR